MYPNTFRSHALRQVFSSMSSKVPPGIAPALLTRMSIFGKSRASSSIVLLSDSSAATTSTFTLDVWRICSRAAARSPALREMRITLQPSVASVCAAARPMPLDAPVITADLPVNCRSIAFAPLQTGLSSSGRLFGRALQKQGLGSRRPACGDHSGDTGAMVDLRGEAEIPLRRSDIERTALNPRPRGIDADPRARSDLRDGINDLLQTDLLGVADEVMQFLSLPGETGSNSSIRCIIDVNEGPVTRGFERNRLIEQSGVYDLIDDQTCAAARSIYAGEAQRTKIERYTLPKAAQNHVYGCFRTAVGIERTHREIGADRLSFVKIAQSRNG